MQNMMTQQKRAERVYTQQTTALQQELKEIKDAKSLSSMDLVSSNSSMHIKKPGNDIQ